MQYCKREVTVIVYVTSRGSKRVMGNGTSPVLSVLVDLLVGLDGLTIDLNRASRTFGVVSLCSQTPSNNVSLVSSMSLLSCCVFQRQSVRPH
jgi:hypothetical protein